MTSVIGLIAAFLTTISFLPQTLKTIKTRDTSGISLMMYWLFIVGVACWLIYGILLHNPIIIIANAITFILTAIILVVKMMEK